MMRNVMEEVAALFDLDLRTEFKIKGCENSTFMFGEGGLLRNVDGGWLTAETTLRDLLTGRVEIKEVLWKPVFDAPYHCFVKSTYGDYKIRKTRNEDTDVDRMRFAIGNFYKTEKDAKADADRMSKILNGEIEIIVGE